MFLSSLNNLAQCLIPMKKSLVILFMADLTTMAEESQAASYTYTPFNPPLLGQLTYYPTGINIQGQAVGYYLGIDHVNHGFIYDNGVYTIIDAPGASKQIQLGNYPTLLAYTENQQNGTYLTGI